MSGEISLAGAPPIPGLAFRPFRGKADVRGMAVVRGQGIREARIHTLAENPHRSWHLYESVGFRVLKRFSRCRKPMDVFPVP